MVYEGKEDRKWRCRAVWSACRSYSKHNRAVRSFSGGVLMVICCCVGTFTSFIWLFGDTNDFPRISRYTFHPISYLPNIHLKHGLISLSLSALFVSPFTFKKNPPGSLKIPSHTHTHTQTHTLVWTNTQCPVSKGFTSAAAAASSLYRQSPANTIRLIWQAKENQTASQYTKEVRAAGALNREALHSLWPSFTAQGGLDRGGGGYLGNNRYTIEEEKDMGGGGGRERGFRRRGWNRTSLFKLCLYEQHVSKKNTSENHQSPRDQSFTLLDALFMATRSLFLRPELCLICRTSQLFRATTGSHRSFCLINTKLQAFFFFFMKVKFVCFSLFLFLIDWKQNRVRL